MPKSKILFFIRATRPSNHERQLALYTGASVFFRNAKLIRPTDSAEECDAVMGAPIPAQYADKPNGTP